jgi:flagellar basal-body rod modification protein FlgD
MDVSKAQNAGLSIPTPTAVSGTEHRDQAAQNATNEIQARYGEKPKEARPVKKALDKDDFMRIMITEMKHQDPTKPMDADRMATQMAQVTSVEQLKNVSTAIEKLAEKSNATDRLAMSAMIGKSVTVDKGRFNHTKGTISPVNFDLPVDASKITLSILDEHGDEIATRQLEPKQAGTNVYNWDGVNASNIQAPGGNYIVRIKAEDAAGAPISVNSISKETVVGVSFDGGDTNFLVGDTKSPQKVNFKNVVRIEGDAATENAARQMTSAKGQAAKASPLQGNNQFSLPEGLRQKLGTAGGSPLGEPTGISAKSAVAAGGAGAPSAQDVAGAMAAMQADHSSGFPNGLKE